MEWGKEELDAEANLIAGEKILKDFGQFINHYTHQLHGLESATIGTLGDTNIWDGLLDPISLQLNQDDSSLLSSLVDTDNVLDKVILTLSSLCDEVSRLTKEANEQYFPVIHFYGEEVCLEGSDGKEVEDDALVFLSRCLATLQKLSFFVSRCYEVVKNMIQQLAVLYPPLQKGETPIVNMSGVHLQIFWRYLGELLSTLICLDCLVSGQLTLREHWSRYKQALNRARQQPAKVDLTGLEVNQLKAMIQRIDKDIMDGSMFKRCLLQKFDWENAIVTENNRLADELAYIIRESASQCDAALVTDSIELGTHQQLLGAAALMVLHHRLTDKPEKKAIKQLIEIQKKLPCVNVYGSCLWMVDKFLAEHMPKIAQISDKKVQQAADAARHAYLQQKIAALQKNVTQCSLQVTLWLLNLEAMSHQQGKQLKYQDMNRRRKLILQGVAYAHNINSTIQSVVNLHVFEGRPMAKTTVLSCFSLLELVKVIEGGYHRHALFIARTASHLDQHLSYLILSSVDAVRKQLRNDKKQTDRHKNILSALGIAECCLLVSCGSSVVRCLLQMALAAASLTNPTSFDGDNPLQPLLASRDIICELGQRVRMACNCSYMYWHKVMLPTYFGNLYDSADDCTRLQFALAALHDCVPSLKLTKHLNSSEVLIDRYKNAVYGFLKEKILDRLCRDTETELRLLTHRHLDVGERNPFRVGIAMLSPFLRLSPFLFFDSYIHIKAHVESYLEKTFYNLTTVALHDWRTYGSMRSIAMDKFAMKTVDDHLPSQTLEQGLDVLEIMRNIQVFVSGYVYNLNTQVFVEKTSNNKHLNTIGIRHIGNSIRAHGTGIMNTTVNYTYQFLRKKFYVFSQFLYDDHIKSRLMKDARFFRDNKNEIQDMYPWERAERLNRGIRKLGVTSDGLTYMDQFRILITEIGNAMGYIRMIRSGGLHCCRTAVRSIPDLEDIVNFEELCQDSSLPSHTVQAAKFLDSVIGNMTRNFAEGTDYFKSLVDVFAPVFRNPRNQHLKQFYIILPTLILNWVEHSIRAKELLNKKNKTGAIFTDDGFAMGVAYILTLLEQWVDFDSLHWFRSVDAKYEKDRGLAQQQKERVEGNPSSQSAEKLRQTVVLTMKRLDLNHQEYQLMYYSLCSARIFFKSDQPSALEGKPEESQEHSKPAT